MKNQRIGKQMRAIREVIEFDKDRKPLLLGKIVGYTEAKPREKIEFEFHGETITIYKAPGQIINPKKEYKRQMKARGLYAK